jgi:hypothetical protein
LKRNNTFWTRIFQVAIWNLLVSFVANTSWGYYRGNLKFKISVYSALNFHGLCLIVSALIFPLFKVFLSSAFFKETLNGDFTAFPCLHPVTIWKCLLN